MHSEAHIVGQRNAHTVQSKRVVYRERQLKGVGRKADLVTDEEVKGMD